MRRCKCGTDFINRGAGLQCPACKRATCEANASVVTQEVLNDAHSVAIQNARKSGKFHLLDELDAAALEGVALAASTWSSELGVPFKSFAFIRANGACKDLLRSWFGQPDGRRRLKMEAAPVDLHAIGGYEDACGFEDSAELRWFGLTMDFQCESFVERVKEILKPNEWLALSTFMTGNTLQSIADHLGVTESRACQLRKAALNRLLDYRDELTLLDPRAA